MQRCLKTAAALSDSISTSLVDPVLVHNRLYEDGGCFYYDNEGKAHALPGATEAEILAKYATFRCLPGMEAGWYCRDAPETTAEFDDRATEVAEWLWREQKCCLETGVEAIFIVAHGNLISGVMSTLLSKHPRTTLFCHYNTGMSLIELHTYRGRDVAVCQGINRIDHLTDFADLAGGSHTTDDQWIQEFVAGL
jgi:broad specificity phosphatase PhoE